MISTLTIVLCCAGVVLYFVAEKWLPWDGIRTHIPSLWRGKPALHRFNWKLTAALGDAPDKMPYTWQEISCTPAIEVTARPMDLPRLQRHYVLRLRSARLGPNA